MGGGPAGGVGGSAVGDLGPLKRNKRRVGGLAGLGWAGLGCGLGWALHFPYEKAKKKAKKKTPKKHQKSTKKAPKNTKKAPTKYCILGLLWKM